MVLLSLTIACANSWIAVRNYHFLLLYRTLNRAQTDPQYAQYLNPSFAQSESSSMPSYSSMTSEEFDALLAEMEPEIRNAERDMREIELLEKRDVLSAGKLVGTLPYSSSRLEVIYHYHFCLRLRVAFAAFRRPHESSRRRCPNCRLA